MATKSPLLNKRKIVNITRDTDRGMFLVTVSNRKFFDIPIPIFTELHKAMGNKHRPVNIEIDFEHDKIRIEKKYQIDINYKLKLSTIEPYQHDIIRELMQEIFENLLAVLIDFQDISFYV